VARLKNPLMRKVERVLAQEFPPPATIRLEEIQGIVGVVTSERFAGMDGVDRQGLMADFLAKHLSREEQRQVQIIVAVTPDEETAYLAGKES